MQPTNETIAGDVGLADDLVRDLDAECARQGFSAHKAAAWKHGMIDPDRGERIWTWLSPYLPERPRLLDLGCGYGAAAAGLLAHTDAVWGLDVRLDRAHFTRRRLPKLRGAVVGDAGNLPFADAAFDGIVLHDVIEHVPPGRQPAVMAELSRVLREGGVVSMRAPNRWQFRDEHNENVPFATWLPGPLRRGLCRIASPSAYCHTWNLTWGRLTGMIDDAGFEILYGPRRMREKVFKATFVLCLRKRS